MMFVPFYAVILKIS